MTQARNELAALLQAYHDVAPSDSIADLAARYQAFAKDYYRRSGQLTGEHRNIDDALKDFVALFGDESGADITTTHLKVFQKELVKKGLARSTINKRANLVRRWFKWLVSERLVPVSVTHELWSVPNLKLGRSAAREPEPIKPVDMVNVRAAKRFMPPTVRAMVLLQLLTACRPGEIRILKASDIDRRQSPWIYRLSRHKTAHHGHIRVIYFGPRAQKVLRRFLNRPDYLFSPMAAQAERVAKRHARRITPESCGNRIGTNRVKRIHRALSHVYTTSGYAQAIRHACQRAHIPSWSPNQLRHTALTRLRRQVGLDEARAIAGHSRVETTQIYAERDAETVRKIMGKIG